MGSSSSLKQIFQLTFFCCGECFVGVGQLNMAAHIVGKKVRLAVSREFFAGLYTCKRPSIEPEQVIFTFDYTGRERISPFRSAAVKR